MNRRNVLKLTGAGLVATVLPLWLARGFANRAIGDLPDLDDDLGNALDRARRLGKPVIVFVVPRDDSAKWERGELYGDALRYGGDALFADLALAELVCAGADDVAERFPEVDDGTEPLAYIIHKDTGRAQIRRLGCALSARSQVDPRGAGVVAEAAFAKWIAPFVALLRSAVCVDGEQLAYRETIARRSLDSNSIDAADQAIAERTPTRLPLVDKCAALFRSAAESSNEARELWLPLLAQAARRRMWEAPPPGARWATTSGCGVDVEGEGDSDGGGVACGIGHTPEGSQRLLYFFTRDE